MKTTLNQIRKDEKGFTLVELAIVMIVIGLLVTGVLKGQEMINGARVTSTISQLKGIEAASNTFIDIYGTVAGDITNPTNRLPDCADECAPGASTNGQLGDGRLDNDPGLAVANETEAFFPQLFAADLVGGTLDSDNFTLQTDLGTSVIAAGYLNGSTAPTSITDSFEPRAGHYLAVTGSLDGAMDAGITPTQAGRIDRKLDDGLANAGSVLGADAGAEACTFEDANNAGDYLYRETETAAVCGMYIRFN